MTFWKTREFKELQAEWYAKLKVSGFQDAEVLIDGEPLLRQGADHPYRYSEPTARVCKEAYFRILSEYVRQAPFRNKTDRIILVLRAEGAKIQQICDTLAFLGRGRYRGTIRYTIRKYEMQWGIRRYSPKELNQVRSA